MPLPFPYNLANLQQGQLAKRSEIFIGPENFMVTGTAGTLTRTAKGNLYYALGASASTQFTANLDVLLHDFTPSPVSYAYKGKSWGLNINYAQAIYLAGAVNLAVATLGISYSTFSTTAAAPTVVDLIAPSNLTLAFGVNIIISQVAPANPAAVAPFGSEILIEAIFHTAAAASLNFYGVLLDVMTD